MKWLIRGAESSKATLKPREGHKQICVGMFTGACVLLGA